MSNTPRTLAGALLAVITAACVFPPDPAGAGLTDNVSDWRDEVIYQIMVDRFSNGDASNDYNTNLSDPSAYHGGDWRGIIDRLDYLQALGVTALWISPVVKNVESDAGFSSYHGYWAQDFTRTNPHFGDLAALRELTDEAHARGFKIILDIVTNHVGQAFFYDINKNGQPDEFFMGQGGEIIPIGQEEPSSELTRVTEWDPDYSSDGIQAWTSLGPSGEAPAVFVYNPAINRIPPVPELFSRDYAYNRKGRVTVWTHPEACGCEPWGCPWTDSCRREQEVLGDFPGGLKDLATTRQDVRDELARVYARWIEVGDFDGFRIDTLKHVEQGFWEDFCPRMRRFARKGGKRNFLMFGEAFDGDDNLLGYYTEGRGVDSVFYFSQYYTLYRGAFLGDGSRTCEIERLHCRRHGCSNDPCAEGLDFTTPLYDGNGKTDGPTAEDGALLDSRQLVVGFASNHDVGRFLYFMPEEWSETRKREVLHQGLSYLMTIDGIPCLYYGVEQEFSGGNDPANRETMWDPAYYRKPVWKDERWQWAQKTYDADGDGADDAVWAPWDTGNPTFAYIQRLVELRKQHAALRRGGLRVRWSTAGSGGDDHGILAFERTHPSGNVLVVMNLGSDSASRTEAGGSTMRVGFAPPTTLRDLLDGTEVAVTGAGCTPGAGEGCVVVTVPARGVRVLAE